MSIAKIIHLIADLSLGGVTKNLEVFEQPFLANKYTSERAAVKPEWKMANRYEADIIITHFSPSWANLPYLYSLRKKNPKAKIFHMEHSYSPEWEAHNVPEPHRFRMMLKLCYAQFDKVICVSKTQSEWLMKINVLTSEQFEIINPWCELAPLLDIKLPDFWNAKPLTIGCYGRLVKEKGFQDLLEAFLGMPQLGDMKLKIGGYGPDEQLLKYLARTNPNVEFHGLVEDVAQFMKSCDIIAVPSYFETFGLVATEALAAGRPVMVSPVGALVEQMGNAGLTVNFKNHRRTSNTLATLDQLPLKSMSKAGRDASQNKQVCILEAWDAFFRSVRSSDSLFSRAA